MVLNNVTLINGDTVNIVLGGNRITQVTHRATPVKAESLQLNFTNALVFPGLINSHDHLDFNLFPQLGDRTYSNYTEWGKYIHENYKAEIAQVLQVPVPLREQWGIIKNMICGVTTVVNHGEKIRLSNPLITVHERYQCIHSVQFEKRWKLKLNNPLKRKPPVVIHIGEGTDQASRNEIDQLLKWNLLKKTLVGVHGVAMSSNQAKKFKALVWCPQSNYFLLNKTAGIKHLKNTTTILLGTDSTLTSHWDIWDHITSARKTGMLTDEELYNSLTVNPANTWGIKNTEIKPGHAADLVITALKDSQPGLDAFFGTVPDKILLVVHQGEIRLFDASLLNQFAQTDLSAYSKINVNGFYKYIRGDVPALLTSIKHDYPEARFPVFTD